MTPGRSAAPPARPREMPRLVLRRLATREVAILLAISAFYWTSQWLTFRLGLIPGDEGFTALAALRLLQGERPYADFPWPYGPTALLLNAGLFRLLGVGLITLRLGGLAAGFASLLLAWRLAHRMMPPWWAAAAATVALSLYRLPVYNYNHIYGTAIGLAAVGAAWAALQRRSAVLWAVSGTLIGLVCSVKLNVGLQAGFAIALFALLTRQPRSAVLSFAAPMISVVLVEHVALMAWLGGWPGISRAFGFQMGIAEQYLADWSGAARLASILPRSLSREAARQVYYGLLFLSPLVAPLLAWRASRRDPPAIRAGVRLLALYSPAVYLQAFVVADPLGSTGDNSALLPTTLLLGGYLFYRWASSRQRRVDRWLVLAAACAAGLIIYLGALVRYATPGKFDWTLALPRAEGIRVSAAYGSTLEETVRFVQSQVPADEAIAALPSADLIPFLAERDQAFRGDEDALQALEEDHPAWVVLTNIEAAGASGLGLHQALERDYVQLAQFGLFVPLSEEARRAEPTWEDRLAYRVYARRGFAAVGCPLAVRAAPPLHADAR